MSILLALQQTGKQSATDLAETLEVSVRTIYRDVDALSASGVPIFAERGSQGGIVLADSYRDALARFDESELRALFVSSDEPLADLGLVDGRRSALKNLASAMPKHSRDALGFERSRIHVDGRRWMGASSAPPPALPALQEAVWNDRSVVIAYTDRNGAVTRRTVDAFGLVAKAGVWYLVARHGETVKTFRVQRIARVRILERRFKRPSTFDVGDYWKTSANFLSTEEAPYVATFRMSRTALANVSMYLTIESKTRAKKGTESDWLVRIAFPSMSMAMHEALNWHERAVAVDPPELRQRIRERALALCSLYA